MAVLWSTSLAETSKTWVDWIFVLVSKKYFRKDSCLYFLAEVHVLIHQDIDGQVVRHVHEVVGYHSPECFPSLAFIQVLYNNVFEDFVSIYIKWRDWGIGWRRLFCSTQAKDLNKTIWWFSRLDRIWNQLGWVIDFYFIWNYNNVYFEDDAIEIQFDSVCPQHYQFLPNINKWKQKVIPRYILSQSWTI